MKSDHATTNVILIYAVMTVLNDMYKPMPILQTKQVDPAIVVLLAKKPVEEVTQALSKGAGVDSLFEG